MHLQARDGERVRRDEAAEPPVSAQHVGEQPAIAARRHVVQIHVGRHETADARLHRGMKRHQVHVPHQLLGDVRPVIVSAPLGRAVAREMLHARDHAERPEGVALEAAHLGACHGGAEVGIFAAALLDAPPARIARDVDHGREGPADPDALRLARREGLRRFFHRRIPGRRHAERDREDRAIAVDHVEAEQQRDVQPALLEGEMLQPIDLLRIGEPQHRADATVDVVRVCCRGDEPSQRDAGHQVELADLLLERHPAEQGVGANSRVGARPGPLGVKRGSKRERPDHQ